MNKDKSLTATKKATIYQREKLVDKIQFLLPQKYEQLDIRDCIIVLRYIDQGNVAHAEKLIQDEELYKERIRCLMDVNTDLTRFAGDIKAHLSFLRLNPENSLHEEVLKSGEILITISPINELYAFAGDDYLDIVDKAMLELEAKQKAQDLIAETYNKEKADNLVLDRENSSIYLESNGIPINKSTIPLNNLGDAISDETESGLIRVITEDEIEVPTPDDGQTIKYTLQLNQDTDELLLLANGIVVSVIPTKDIGESIIDSTPEGLNEIITQ